MDNVQDSCESEIKSIMEEYHIDQIQSSDITDAKHLLSLNDSIYYPAYPEQGFMYIPENSYVTFVKDSNGNHHLENGKIFDESTVGYLENDIRLSLSSDSFVRFKYFNSHVPNCYIRELTSEYVERFKKQMKIDAEKHHNSKEQILKISKLKESLEAIFPGNWDIQYTFDDSQAFSMYKYTVIIRFPEITIRNSAGLTHDIKDLYVSLVFDDEFRIIEKLHGKRGTLSYVEASCKYRHSHLPGGNSDPVDEGFSKFCLGGGSEISHLLSYEWNDIKSIKDLQIEFELLLYQIDSYVRWESIEGGPYFGIGNIHAPGDSTSIGLTDKNIAWTKFISNINSFPCKFDKTKGLFDISFEDIEDRLYMDSIEKVTKTPLGQYIYGKLTIGQITKIVNDWNKDIKEFHKKIPPLDVFKGKPLIMNVEEFKTDGDRFNTRKVAHPDITNFIRKKLIKSMNYYFTKNYGK